MTKILNTIIKNIGNIYTPKLSGQYGEITHLTHASLLIKDGLIEEVYHDNNFSTDKNTDIIDAGGLTLLPGFVDAHTHPVFWNTREAEFLMRIEGKTYEEIANAGGGIRNSARDFRDADKSDIKQRTANRIKTFLE